jgi:hypothetical protein
LVIPSMSSSTCGRFYNNSIHVSRKFNFIAPAVSNLACSWRTPKINLKEGGRCSQSRCTAIILLNVICGILRMLFRSVSSAS